MKTDSIGQQYRQTLSLALPVIMSQAGQIAVQFADNAMVGQLGALPLAAVSLGGAVIFILYIFGIGLSMGLTPLTGELFARGDRQGMGAFLRNAAILYAAAGLVLLAAQYAMIPAMRHMGQPAEVIDIAIPYYKYLMWSMIPVMLFAPFKQFLEGIGDTRTPMVIIITSNAVNILLNWVFIYGHLGCQAMGAAGAGLSTLVARVCCPVLAAIYFLSRQELRSLLLPDGTPLPECGCMRSLLGVGLPIAAQITLESAAFVATTVMMGYIGTIELAANQIVITMANMAFMIVLGVGSAATIRTSHAVGLRDPQALHLAAKASYHIGLAWNAAIATIFILLRNRIPALFTPDADVIRVASQLLVLAAMFQFSDGLQCISMSILRGIRDVKITAVIAAVSYLGINLPAGYLLAFTLRAGAPGLWGGYIFGLSVAALLLGMRCRRKLKSMRSQWLNFT